MSAETPAPPRSTLVAVRDVASALAIAAAGAALFFALGLPAPALVGSVVVTSAAALAGIAKPLPRKFRDVVFVLLGASMGSAVTPATIEGVLKWPGSMVALAVAVTAMVAASYLILRRGFGFDRTTAFYASPPGALSATLALAATTDADMRKVAVVQVFRVFVLVAVVPATISATGAHSAAASAALPQAGLWGTLAILALGVAGAAFARLVKLPGGLMIGAFGASAVLHATGVLTFRLPDLVTLPSFVALGAIVGTRFAGMRPSDIMALIKPTVASFLAVTALGVAFALGVGWALGLPAAQVFVAFAPGGLEAMMLTAYLLGLDPAYVGAHHVARFVALSFAVPVVARMIGAGVARRDEAGEDR